MSIHEITDQQNKILGLVAQGMTNRQIGAQLYLTENTIKVQLSRMFRKIGARDRAHAVALAFRAGVLT